MRMVSSVEAVAEVRARLAGRTGTRWVGVDGLAGAGKSTLAVALAAAVPTAVVVAVDDFARPGTPTWETDRFAAEVLRPLLTGRPGRYRRWPYDSPRPLEEVQVPAGVPVLVEGVSCTDVRLPVPWDVTIWVEAPVAVRRARLEARAVPGLVERWLSDWAPSEEAYLAAQRPAERADLVVDAGRGDPSADGLR